MPLLSGANALVRKYNLVTRTPGLQFTVPGGFSNEKDLAVVPGSPGTLAIGASPQVGCSRIYDDGVRRPLSLQWRRGYAINSLSNFRTRQMCSTDSIVSSIVDSLVSSPFVRQTGATGTFVGTNLFNRWVMRRALCTMRLLPLRHGRGHVCIGPRRPLPPRSAHFKTTGAMAIDPAI
jgi:hypothetical protein